MKIEKLILKNFASIQSAMDTNAFSLDLTNTTNKICLLIGKNGSGKTSVLSMLTPFAEVGNLDARKDQPLILAKKEGYKEIHIKDNDNLYVIKHYYTPHEGKSHSIKSYIEKNGVELNVNGNVTSFKEIVKEELQIETEYLKLIRLGSNVIGMLELTETERKTFMSKILHEVDIYLEYYKLISNKLKRVKDIISHTVNKIDKLGFTDEEFAKSEIKQLISRKDTAHELYIKLHDEIIILKAKQEQIGDIQELTTELKEKQRLLTKIENILTRKSDIKHHADWYEKEVARMEKEVVSSETKQTSNVNLMQSHLTHINSLENQLNEILTQEEKESNYSQEMKRVNERLINLRKLINKSEEVLEGFKPTISQQELEHFIVVIKNLQLQLERTYEFGKKPIQKVVELVNEGTDVRNYINQQLIKMDGERSNETAVFLTHLQNQYTFRCAIEEKCKETECEARKLYLEIKRLLNTKENSEKTQDIGFYKDMQFIYDNLYHIIKIFKEEESLIQKLPPSFQTQFSSTAMYQNILNLNPIFDEKGFNQLLMLVTEYTHCEELKKEKKETEDKLSTFQRNDRSSYFKKQKEKVTTELDDLKTEVRTLREENNHLKESVDEMNRSIDNYQDIILSLTQFDSTKTRVDELMQVTKEWNDNTNALKDLEIDESIQQKEVERLEKEIQNKNTALSEYKDLSKDLKKLNKEFDEMTLIKESLSSRTGIPLHFIMNYLGNVVDVTNELLDTIYNGDLYLDQFEITPSSFSIPFYNKGIRISDVKYASQGELSFISIALSFALSSRSIGRYNIRLLDEIDGPLDTTNREHFIKMIETQSDMIDAEQCFLITHNQMFSAYPVDIIDLSFQGKHDEYPLANFIPIEKG